jgi:hypothetical protein
MATFDKYERDPELQNYHREYDFNIGLGRIMNTIYSLNPLPDPDEVLRCTSDLLSQAVHRTTKFQILQDLSAEIASCWHVPEYDRTYIIDKFREMQKAYE